MKRLTKTYDDNTHGAADDLPCGENSYEYKNLLLEKLGKYEDEEEQGLLLRLPCKEGTIVWKIIHHLGGGRVPDWYEKVEVNFHSHLIDEIDKNVFLDEAKADKLLKILNEIN